MNKIQEILSAWGISFNPNEGQAKKAAERIKVCNSCEHKESTLGVNRCKVCGCALRAKIFSPVDGACPEGKWDSIDKKMKDDLMKSSEKETIFIQMASYRDPELGPTLDDLIENSKYPDRLHICVCFQYHPDDEFNKDIDKYRDDKRFTFIDVLYSETLGTCWARNQIQQKYKNETYTLQLDSHHRFAKDWDEEAIFMYKTLQSEGYEKPLLTAYIPSYDPDNDPAGRAQVPWRLTFDRFIPEGAVFFLPEELPDKSKPQLGRFFSAHFAFTTGKFCLEVPHDPDYYFHGEEISLAVRAWTHGYDIFYPNKIIAWHEYTRKGRTKHWDDDTTWNTKNDKSHAKNRQLFGVDNEKPTPENKKTFKKYGLGKKRSLKEYEVFAGLRFSDRSVTKHVTDKQIPPGSPDHEYYQRFKHCIDQWGKSFNKRDYTFIAIILHDQMGNELYRKDLQKNEIDAFFNSGEEWWKIWVEYNGPTPHKWIVWPHSESEGWVEYREGILENVQS